MENVFFHPEEAGYTCDPANNLHHVNFAKCYDFALQIADYSEIYINTDREYFFNQLSTETKIRNEENQENFEYIVSEQIKDQLDFFIYAFGNVKRKPRVLLIGGVPEARKMVGFRSMIHLCDEVVVMGPLGLVFLMYN